MWGHGPGPRGCRVISLDPFLALPLPSQPAVRPVPAMTAATRAGGLPPCCLLAAGVLPAQHPRQFRPRRDGRCDTGSMDYGTHTVCAKVTNEFLQYTLQHGNDLITPRPEHR